MRQLTSSTGLVYTEMEWDFAVIPYQTVPNIRSINAYLPVAQPRDCDKISAPELVITDSPRYENPGARGDRRLMCRATTSNICNFPADLVAGKGASSLAWLKAVAVAGEYIRFNFGDISYVINEAILYSSSASYSHGTWKWQGSDDGVTWVDIGASFTLGGATAQVMTTLNGNVTAYKQYQLVGVSGTASASPFLWWIDFKISSPSSGATAYYYTLSSGCRTGRITASQSASIFPVGSAASLIDGSGADQLTFFFRNGAAAGEWISFDFGGPVVIDEAVWSQRTTAAQGDWKWQGSNNGADWDDIGGSFTLSGAPVLVGSNTVPDYYSYLDTLHGNITGYRHYRMLGVGGSTTNGPFLYEMYFRIAGSLEDLFFVSPINGRRFYPERLIGPFPQTFYWDCKVGFGCVWTLPALAWACAVQMACEWDLEPIPQFIWACTVAFSCAWSLQSWKCEQAFGCSWEWDQGGGNDSPPVEWVCMAGFACSWWLKDGIGGGCITGNGEWTLPDGDGGGEGGAGQEIKNYAL